MLDEELHDLCGSPDIVRVIDSRSGRRDMRGGGKKFIKIAFTDNFNNL